MTQEDKQLLLKDLCGRLPYGVTFKDECDENLHEIYYIRDEDIYTRTYPNLPSWIETIKPYLRPMSSMTEEEFEKLKEYSGLVYDQLDLASFQNGAYKCLDFYLNEVPTDIVILVFDWLNAHQFDYRGLIEKGLALKAKEGMYKTK